jgi:hypothetical protein
MLTELTPRRMNGLELFRMVKSPELSLTPDQRILAQTA